MCTFAGILLVFWLDKKSSQCIRPRFGEEASELGSAAAVGSRTSVDDPAVPTDDGSCPIEYPRHSLEDVRAGTLPYLMGGIAQRPGCAICNRTDGWSLPCLYKNGPLCPGWVQTGLIDSWVARGFALPLTLTPCDLWPHLHGRTLFFMGDSMMLDFFKVLPPALSCGRPACLSFVPKGMLMHKHAYA